MEKKLCESCRYKNGDVCGIDNEPLERIDRASCFNYERKKRISLLAKNVAIVMYNKDDVYFLYGLYAYEEDAQKVVNHLKRNGYENFYYFVEEILFKIPN